MSGEELADVVNDFQRGIVAALDGRTGDLLWVGEGETATGKEGAGPGISFLGPLALSKSVVVAGGGRELAGPSVGTVIREGAVRAYDQKSGQLLWSKRVAGTGLAFVAASGKLAFVGATVGTSEDPSIELAAYDLLTGALVWDESYGADENARLSVLVASGRYVALVASQDGPGVRDVAVRVHDAKTGEFLFDDVFDDGNTEASFAAAVRGRRLFVAGYTEDSMAERDGLLLAYDLGKRTRIWDQSVAEDGIQNVIALAVSGSAVFELVYGTQPDPVARARDARTGGIRWDEDIDTDLVTSPDAITAKGRRVIVAVGSGIFAFDSRTGAPAWDSMTGGLDGAIAGKWLVVPGFGGVDGYPAR